MQKTNKAESQAAKYDELKKEYLASKISLRKLSEKYNVPFANIQRLSKKEGWGQLRIQIADKQGQKVVESIASKRASNADKAMNIIDKLMDKLGKSIDVVKDGDVQAMKQLVGAMKDLRDIGVFDMGEKKDISVSIRLEGELEDYAQ